MKQMMEYCVTDDPVIDPEYRWQLFARFREDGKVNVEDLAKFKTLKFAQAVADLLNSQVR